MTRLDQHRLLRVGGGSMVVFAAYLGIPVSTTHIITGGVVGTGAARRASAVRWGIAAHVMIAWIITIPAAASWRPCSIGSSAAALGRRCWRLPSSLQRA